MTSTYQEWRNEFNFDEELESLEQLLPIDNEEEAMQMYEERLRQRVVQSKEPLPNTISGRQNRQERYQRENRREREPFTYNRTYNSAESEEVHLPSEEFQEASLQERLRHKKYRAPVPPKHPQQYQDTYQQPQYSTHSQSRQQNKQHRAHVYSQKQLLDQEQAHEYMVQDNSVYEDNVAMARQIQKLLKQNKRLMMEVDYRDAELQRYKQVFGNLYIKRDY